MPSIHSCRSFVTAMVLLILLPVVALRASGQTESILFNFDGKQVGSTPWSHPVMDSQGNLYGMTIIGGIHNSGTIFELSPSSSGWTVKTLHAFGNTGDGGEPLAGLTIDVEGNLYGATAYGGSAGFGTVFQLKPNSNGTWSERILHSFSNNGKDGIYPASNLTLDSAGNLYGTTTLGGIKNGGIVFELSHPSGGSWVEKILTSLPNPQNSSNSVSESVTFDSGGNLYGVTSLGGAHDQGFVFELTPKASGPWNQKLLYSFNSANSGFYQPTSGVTLDSAGNLYGVAYDGGSGNVGAAYELSPSSSGTWTAQVIWDPADCSTGCQPLGDFTMDATGNLYGTAFTGGAYNYFGTIYKLSPSGNGAWTQTDLHDFGSAGDGEYPAYGVLLSASGNIYGATEYGGAKGDGLVFEIVP